MITDEERAIRRAYEAFNRRDAVGVLAPLDASIEFRMPLDPMGEHPVYRGLDGVRELYETLWEAFDELRAEIADVTSLGEVFVVSGRVAARPRGAPAPTSYKFAHFWRVRDGRAVAVAFHDAVNLFALLDQRAGSTLPRRTERD